ERHRQFAVANHVRITGYRTGQVAGALAVDGIRVPDSADVDSVPDNSNQIRIANPPTRAYNYVRSSRSWVRIKAAPATFSEPIAVQGWKLSIRPGARAELFFTALVREQTMRVVVVRKQSDEPAFTYQIDSRGRNPFAGDSPAHRAATMARIV